jgi:hypothetical protein
MSVTIKNVNIITITTDVDETPKTHRAFKLHDFDTALLIECVKSRQKEVNKILEHYDEASEVEKIRNDAFDLQGLLGMLKESQEVKCVIPLESLEKGWSFEHNVDMPMAYSDNLKDDMFEDVNIK